jgi:hypothetical protein
VNVSKQTEYVAGWIDTTIHDFLLDIEEPSSSMAYALITCVDSSFDIGSFWKRSKQLSKLKGKFKLVGQGLLITAHQLLAVERQHRLFFGFDEVWFFPKSDITAKPENWVITGPEPIDPLEIEQHFEWMRSNNCSLGLGDGAGMNYCLRVKGAARYVIGAINESGSHTAADPHETAERSYDR